MEKTFLMVKPDGVQRGIIGEIITRFEKKGFKIVAAKFMTISEELANKHYNEHVGKPFFNDLVSFITSGPVLAMVLEGEDVIASSRQMMGKTNPHDAEIGTIRGDYAVVMNRNLIHGSDSKENAQREISLFFDEKEIQDYDKAIDNWIH
ncbi:nucleoside-diphosphate kinase [Saliterribacillus persicus]|nr:nucleoside-diphosphate kinase [Saliterribacillus persicus]